LFPLRPEVRSQIFASLIDQFDDGILQRVRQREHLTCA
jgi:hypothetical protein